MAGQEGPTPATIAQALAATLAAHPAAPPLRWALDHAPLLKNAPHLIGYTFADQDYDPEERAAERVAAVRTWSRALARPLFVRDTVIVTLTTGATLPGGVRLEITETVLEENLPADLAATRDTHTDPLPF